MQSDGMNGSPLVTVFFIYGDCLIKKTVQAQICGSMDWIARSRVGLQLQPELDPRHKFFFTKRGEVFFFFISFTLVSIVTSVIVAGAVSILFLLWSSFFLFLLFISFLLLLVVGLGCFIRFGLDPTRPAFAFLRVRVIEGRVFFPSVRTDDGERNLSIDQSRPNGLCPTPAQIRPRATRSTFALSLFFLLQPLINVGSGAIFIPLFFFFFFFCCVVVSV